MPTWPGRKACQAPHLRSPSAGSRYSPGSAGAQTTGCRWNPPDARLRGEGNSRPGAGHAWAAKIPSGQFGSLTLDENVSRHSKTFETIETLETFETSETFEAFDVFEEVSITCESSNMVFLDSDCRKVLGAQVKLSLFSFVHCCLEHPRVILMASIKRLDHKFICRNHPLSLHLDACPSRTCLGIPLPPKKSSSCRSFTCIRKNCSLSCGAISQDLLLEIWLETLTRPDLHCVPPPKKETKKDAYIQQPHDVSTALSLLCSVPASKESQSA